LKLHDHQHITISLPTLHFSKREQKGFERRQTLIGYAIRSGPRPRNYKNQISPAIDSNITS